MEEDKKAVPSPPLDDSSIVRKEEEIVVSVEDDDNIKNVLITGANSGIGFECARMMAGLKKYRICLAGRNEEALQESVERIKASTGWKHLEILIIDLTNFQSVREAAKKYKETHEGQSIHRLILNAGIMALPTRRETEDGHEFQLQTNHLSHFLLLHLLHPLLVLDAEPRCISVSSLAHRGALIRFDDPDFKEEESYSPWKAYGQSKLSNIMMIKGLSTKSTVPCYSLHPGMVRTNLGRNFAKVMKIAVVLMYPLYMLFSLSPEKGAATSFFLATQETIDPEDNGKYFAKSRVAEVKPGDMDQLTPESLEKFWQWSSDLVPISVEERKESGLYE